MKINFRPCFTNLDSRARIINGDLQLDLICSQLTPASLRTQLTTLGRIFFLNVDTNVDVASPDLIISCDVRRDAATCLFLLWILKLQEPRVDTF